MIEYIPEVVVVGDVEMLFFGAAVALGMPKAARKIVRSRYGPGSASESKDGEKGDEECGPCDKPDCPRR